MAVPFSFGVPFVYVPHAGTAWPCAGCGLVAYWHSLPNGWQTVDDFSYCPECLKTSVLTGGQLASSDKAVSPFGVREPLPGVQTTFGENWKK